MHSGSLTLTFWKFNWKFNFILEVWLTKFNLQILALASRLEFSMLFSLTTSDLRAVICICIVFIVCLVWGRKLQCLRKLPWINVDCKLVFRIFALEHGPWSAKSLQCMGFFFWSLKTRCCVLLPSYWTLVTSCGVLVSRPNQSNPPLVHIIYPPSNVHWWLLRLPRAATDHC